MGSRNRALCILFAGILAASVLAAPASGKGPHGRDGADADRATAPAGHEARDEDHGDHDGAREHDRRGDQDGHADRDDGKDREEPAAPGPPATESAPAPEPAPSEPQPQPADAPPDPSPAPPPEQPAAPDDAIEAPPAEHGHPHEERPRPADETPPPLPFPDAPEPAPADEVDVPLPPVRVPTMSPVVPAPIVVAPPPAPTLERVIVFVPVPAPAPPSPPPVPEPAPRISPLPAPWAAPIEDPRTIAVASLGDDGALLGPGGIVLFSARLPDAGEPLSQFAVSPVGKRASSLILALPLLAASALVGLAVTRSRIPDAAPPRPRAGLKGILLLAQEAVLRGDHAEGARWFETALAVQPRLAVAHFCLGLCLEELGRAEEARESFEHALALDPSEPVVRYRLARCYAVAGRAADACTTLLPLFRASPDVAEVASQDDGFATLRDHPMFLRALGKL